MAFYTSCRFKLFILSVYTMVNILTVTSQRTRYDFSPIYTRTTTVRYNICGSKCCTGWSYDTSTGSCTKPVCVPYCKNGGKCVRPNYCTCPTGYTGNYCERQAISSTRTQSQPVGGYRQLSVYRTSWNYNRGTQISSQIQPRPTTPGACYRRISGSRCAAPITDMTTNMEDCCNSIGMAFGSPCRSCSSYYTQGHQCPRGFKSDTHRRCIDVNECSSFEHLCMHGLCINTLGSYRCDCNYGYVSDSSNTQCVRQKHGRCFTKDQCVTDSLSGFMSEMDCCCSGIGKSWGDTCITCPAPDTMEYRALCPQGNGYKYLPAKVPDTDTEVVHDSGSPTQTMCEKFNNLCSNGKCVGTDQRSYTCTCNEGYQTSSNGLACVPKAVDRCAANTNLCPNGRCVSLSSSYRCICDDGYRPTTNSASCILATPTNKCTSNRNLCPNGRCIMSGSNYRCICNSGYRPSSNGAACIAVSTDFCAVNRNLCTNGRCVSSGETYRCMCNSGYRPTSNNAACVAIPTDKCATTPNLCANGRCVSAGSNYLCICNKGYRPTSNRRTCLAVATDRCAANRNLCSNGRCISSGSSYRCICNSGYRLTSSGTACIAYSINRCTPNLCANGRCVNLNTGYRCICNRGYHANDNAASCIDVNECSLNNGRAVCIHGTCTNTPGTYRCDCGKGMVHRGNHCIDVDECKQGDVCNGAPCINTLRSYVCMTPNCNTGYTYKDGKCVDENECDSQRNICPNGDCVNIEGAYRCYCYDGFRAINQRLCHDINECSTDVDLCGKEANCVNNPGSYRCVCPNDLQFDFQSKKCHSLDSEERKMCFADITDAELCEQVISNNATRQECCCTIGTGWGDDCEFWLCPLSNTEEFKKICPNGRGRKTVVNPERQSTSDQSIYIDSGAFAGDPKYMSERGVDECKTFPSICGTGMCVDTPLSYKCTCPGRHYFDMKQKVCLQENECFKYRGICGNGTCINTDKSFFCKCPPNYAFDNAGRMCKPVDLCANHRCGDGECVVTNGVATCQCQEGYRHSSVLGSCQDINECNEQADICGNGTCVNRLGEYKCYCPKFYEFNEQLRACKATDFCKINREVCGSATCQNYQEGPGYVCLCPTNYFFNATTRSCQSNDVCVRFGVDCGNGTCVTSYGRPVCRCAEGYKFEHTRKTCEVAVICTAFPDMCGNGTCVLLRSGHRCVCPSGFEFESLSKNCLRIDQCRKLEGVCGNATCTDLQGIIDCTCPEGYEFDAQLKSCLVSNECQVFPGICGNGTCQDTPTHYECSCPAQHQFDETLPGCIRIGMCKLYPYTCGNATCLDDNGKIVCVCPAHYEFDTVTNVCLASNECYLYPDVCGNGTCVDLVDGYQCRCNIGYDFDYDTKSCIRSSVCNKIVGLCGGNATCQDTIFGHRCLCPEYSFYDPNDEVCKEETPYDPCTQIPDACGAGATCSAADGLITCTCPLDQEYDVTSRTCVKNLDSCILFPEICGNGTCVNRGVRDYICECPAGYYFQSSENICKSSTAALSDSVNECQIQGVCLNGVCFDLPDGYRCDCWEGFIKVGDECKDVDECEDIDVCQFGTCVNAPGTFWCECEPPLQLDSTQRRCIEFIWQPGGPGMNGATHEERRATCWSSSNCNGLQASSQTYTECCCGSGISWGVTYCDVCPKKGSINYNIICGLPSGIDEIAEFYGQTGLVGKDSAPELLYTTENPSSIIVSTYPPVTEAAAPLTFCERHPSICPNGTCINQDNSYTCLCNSGFKLNKKKRCRPRKQ
ncbi:uncharacterized protein [Antedon mediterranea]|uniref:uncharacterized protein isoform X2 n=1 Tax=Antedon mediterranea TaxID=105859 RepID=UPI003AF864F1